jgi:phage-related holin
MWALKEFFQNPHLHDGGRWAPRDSQINGDGSVLRTAVIFFYLSNEGISMLENAGHLGLPIPEKLKDVLAQLHGRNDKEDGQ